MAAAATRYAKALLDLVVEQGNLEKVKGDADALLELLKANREFALMLKSPIIKADKKEAVLTEGLKGKVEDITLRFAMLLVQKGRESQLASILEAFIEAYNDRKGIKEVKLTGSSEFTPETLNEIKQLASRMLPGKEIRFTTQEDPALVGGFVLQYDDKLLDASVRRQLEIIRQELVNA